MLMKLTIGERKLCHDYFFLSFSQNKFEASAVKSFEWDIIWEVNNLF
jgi:hypothetical protein